MSHAYAFDHGLLRKARAVCPKCTRKGVGWANHPHAYGYKDLTRAVCRYCRASFKRWREEWSGAE